MERNRAAGKVMCWAVSALSCRWEGVRIHSEQEQPECWEGTDLTLETQIGMQVEQSGNKGYAIT